MRIVHVLHSMAVAGAEVLVHDFLARANAGLDQRVVTLDAIGPLGEALREKGIPVECVGRMPGIDAKLPWRLAKAIEAHGADVVHAHQYTPYFYAAIATRLASTRPALIFTEHGRHVPDHRRPKRVLFNQFALSWTARVTAVCAYVKRLLVANEGIHPNRIEVIYNGVDPSRFDGVIDGSKLRHDLGLKPEHRVVTCVARFHSVKDHPTLVQGFANAATHVPSARLLLVGGGDGEKALREQVDQLGIRDRVVFAGIRKDIPEVLAATDLFAMTSLSEGTSVTLLEAMLSRRAAVVTAVGGNPEIVENGFTGLLVPRGDASATGDALARMLKNDAQRVAFGEAGRSRAIEHFTQDRMHRAWRKLYEDAVR